MKSFFLVCLLLTLAIAVYCAPPPHFQDELQDQEIEHTRVKRVTCDLLSAQGGGVSVNHAACALKCITFRGKKGGHCENANCICRDDDLSFSNI